jgi:hypothetical protein
MNMNYAANTIESCSSSDFRDGNKQYFESMVSDHNTEAAIEHMLDIKDIKR